MRNLSAAEEDYIGLPSADRLAPLTVVRDTRELVSADFDGSKLGTVELDDGTRFEVLVDEDLSGRGARFISFDLFSGDESHARWIRDHHDELVGEWDDREAV